MWRLWLYFLGTDRKNYPCDAANLVEFRQCSKNTYILLHTTALWILPGHGKPLDLMQHYNLYVQHPQLYNWSKYVVLMMDKLWKHQKQCRVDHWISATTTTVSESFVDPVIKGMQKVRSGWLEEFLSWDELESEIESEDGNNTLTADEIYFELHYN